MNKFKVGDKVWCNGDVRIIKRVDEWANGEYGYYFNVDDDLLDFWEEEDLELYKTPHQRLLDLGWKVVDTDGIYKTYDNFDTKYTRMTMSIKINKDQDGWYFTTHNVFMDKELTTILLDYLEELENNE